MDTITALNTFNPSGDFLKDSNILSNKAETAANKLSYLAQGFFIVGNPNIGQQLSQLANELFMISEGITAVASVRVNNDFKEAQIMHSAVLQSLTSKVTN